MGEKKVDSISSLWQQLKMRGSAIVVVLAMFASAYLSLGIVVLFLAKSAIFSSSKSITAQNKCKSKTVLVSGAKMTKALFYVRALGRAGHRVVLIETPKYWLSGSRFSRFVSSFYTVPDPRFEEEKYTEAVLKICKDEAVDVFVPLSAPSVALCESRIMGILKSKLNVETLHFNETDCIKLDDKDRFCALSKQFGLLTPVSFRMESKDEIRTLNSKLNLQSDHESSQQYILKSIVYDPLRRIDMFKLPCADTLLDGYLKDITVSKSVPWTIQEFLVGQEYMCGAIFRDGHLGAAAMCKASASVLNYRNEFIPEIFDWMRSFGQNSKCTGSAQVDFFLTNDGRVMPIEFNPRAGSALMMVENSKLGHIMALDEEFFSEPTLQPDSSQPDLYWFYNELGLLVAKRFSIPAVIQFVKEIVRGKDAIFDMDDIFPFLMFNHFQVPLLLLDTFFAGRKWHKVDFCIGKVVEDGGD